jgi:predicted ribosome quality control (RQC) complex YloA/Tae2 family protein
MDETIEELVGQDEKEEKKTDINSLDLRFLVRELKAAAAGGFFKKIYQYGEKSKQFMFELYVPGKQGDVKLYVDGSRVFVTEKKEAVPKEPPSFCMFLRKHLLNRRIKEIKQYEFDRVLEIKTESNILIMEFLKPGNIILCDSTYNIIMPLEIRQWRYRNIKPKSQYSYPPKLENPFDLDFGGLRSIAKKSDKKTVVFLATTLGFGGIYAREICIRAGLELQKSACLLNPEEMAQTLKAVKDMDNEKPVGCVYADFVSPFPMKSLGKKEYKIAGSFSAALDEYFSGLKIEVQKEEAEKQAEERVQKVERIIEKQSKAGEKWERIMADSKESAEKIHTYYTTVEAVINGIRKARQSGISWPELKEKIKAEETAESESIKEIREDEGVVVLKLGGKEIEIDIRKSVEENAAKYFEDVKWARSKIDGLKKSEEEKTKELEKTKMEIEKEKADLDKKTKEMEETKEKVPMRKKRAKWFEKYKWFLTSDGFLVVGGRNAEQNEELVRKHAEDRDWLYHADIAGAAFVLLKTDGKSVTEIGLKEASEFSAANSKAWTRGLGTVDVFAVRPNQATKPQPLPKGSFVITGDRVWFRNIELKISVGVKVIREEERAVVLTGPVMAIRKHSNYFVTIKPGFTSPSELARKIKTSLLVKAKPDDKFYIEQIPSEEFEKSIPSGSADITEWGA